MTRSEKLRCSCPVSVCKASLPVFDRNVCLMSPSSSTHGKCFDQESPLFPGNSGGTSIGSAIGHHHSSPRRNGVTRVCSQRLPVSAALPLPGAAETFHWAISIRCKKAHT